VPGDARREAWDQIKQDHFDMLSSPAAVERWRHIGPAPTRSAFFAAWGNTSGRINAIAVSPSNPQIVLVGSASGGIWRSTNGGTSFAPVSDDQVDLAVGSIAFSKSNPQRVYAGMGDTKLSYLGSGVLLSTDAGESWQRVSDRSLPAPGTIARIEVDPANANRVYVAQYSRLQGSEIRSSGLYVSTDGGVSWSKTFTGWARDVVIHPSNRQTVYLGAASRNPSEGDEMPGLYRSTDSGQTWSAILPSPFNENATRDFRVAVSPANPQKLYCYFGGTSPVGFQVKLWASNDGGSSWVEKNTAQLDVAQFGYNTYIHVDPTDPNRIFVGTRDLYLSTDGGGSWANLTRNFSPFGGFLDYTPALSNTHPDQHAFTFSPSDTGVIYLGNDGGISKSTNGGITFRSMNSSLSLTQFVGVTLHPTDPSISYGGTQDNGTQRRQAGSSQWMEFVGGDGGRSVLSVMYPDIVLTTYIRGNIFRFFQNGNFYDRQVAFNGTFNEPETGARIAFYAPFVGNGVDDTLYFGSWRLFISYDRGDTWHAPGGATDLTKGNTQRGADVLSAIGVARSDTNVIYTGSSQGRAMVSTDRGTTWTDITAGLPDRYISSITTDPTNPSLAYLTLSGYNTGHIFRTTDRGASWQDLSNGLPDIPVSAFLIDPVSPNHLYAGTDIGVFRSTDSGSHWQPFNKGMPPVVVTAFASQPTGLIQAATYGRGAYEIDTGQDRPVIDSVEYKKNKKLRINGSNFDQVQKVIINNVDRSDRIRESGDSSMLVRGKPNVLGIVAGDNSIQIITGEGVGSTVYTFRY
jgi:photosystem II stability/assembly factor-like uncharacterized protein